VVLDVFLGEHNSLGELAALALASGAALLVHTGSRDPQLHRRALECGAFAVVLKEEPAEVLLKEIERADAARRGADSAGAIKAAVEGR
jgi:DNA-binding NarL/FixJ family response regulator